MSAVVHMCRGINCEHYHELRRTNVCCGKGDLEAWPLVGTMGFDEVEAACLPGATGGMIVSAVERPTSTVITDEMVQRAFDAALLASSYVTLRGTRDALAAALSKGDEK